MKALDLKSTLFPEIEALVSAAGFEWIECGLRFQEDASTLSVMIDSLSGVELKDCESVSRKISEFLDEKDSLTGHYYLEVSSPGVERPLKTMEHYKRFIGSEAVVKLAKNKKISGMIVSVDLNGSIAIRNAEGEEQIIEFASIRSGHLVFKPKKGEKKKN